MNAEFKAGQIVHFQAYKERKPIKGRVHWTRKKANDPDRIEYCLKGNNPPLLSITTGLSIVESKFHNPISEKEAFID